MLPCASAGSTGSARRSTSTYYLQKYTPRRARSKWSKINVGKVARADRGGPDAPAGQAEIDAREGRRSLGRRVCARSATIEVPADLQAALDADPVAADTFAGLKGQDRYSILFRLHDAKRPGDPRPAPAKFVDELKRGELSL